MHGTTLPRNGLAGRKSKDESQSKSVHATPSPIGDTPTPHGHAPRVKGRWGEIFSVRQKKVFFFEKKKQKTFASLRLVAR
jgi:hypothetical protein